jgi:predicted ATP-dependent protease
VILPRANVDHLMLREDVCHAAAEGRFHVWAVETVDEALELLSGLPVGDRDGDGGYPEGTANARVECRLAGMAQQAQRFARRPEDEGQR